MKDLDPAALDCLAALVDAGSFERAAQSLSITQSAVSQRLRALETQVGQLLVVRSRPLRLTEPGKVLLRFARQWQAMQADVARELGAAWRDDERVAVAVAEEPFGARVAVLAVAQEPSGVCVAVLALGLSRFSHGGRPGRRWQASYRPRPSWCVGGAWPALLRQVRLTRLARVLRLSLLACWSSDYNVLAWVGRWCRWWW